MNTKTNPDNYGSISIAGKENHPEPPLKKPAERPRPPKDSGPPRRPSRLKWLIATPLLLIALFFLTSYLLIPYLAARVLPDYLGRLLNRPVTVAAAEFDPFSLTLTLHNAIVGPRLDKPQDEIDPILSFNRFMIDLEASGLARGRLVCRKSEIDQFFLHIVREDKDTYNITSLLPENGPAFPGALRYSLNNIKVTGGTVIFTDTPAGKTHKVEKIDLAVPALSNFAYQTENYIQPRFAATVNGSPLELSGETTVRGESLEAKLSLQLKDLDMPEYIAYLPAALPFKIKQGKITLDCGLIFANSPEAATKFQLEGKGQIAGLWLEDQEGHVDKYGQIDFTGRIAPLVHEFVFQEITVSQPEVHLARNRRGIWNVEVLAGPQSTADAPDQQSPLLAIDAVKVTDGKLTITDRSVPKGYTNSWSGLQLSLKSFDSRSDTPAEFALAAQSSRLARISTQGRILPAQGVVEGLVVMNEADLVSLNPYFSTWFPALAVKSGQAAKLETQFAFGYGKGKERFTLKNLGAAVKNLALEKEGRTFFTGPAVACSEGELNFSGRTLNLGKIHGEKAALSLGATAEGFQLGGIAPAPADAKEKKPWAATLAEANFSESSISIQTRVAATPLTLDFTQVNLGLTPPAAPESAGKIEGTAVLNGSGALKFTGPVQFSPFDAKLTVSLEKQAITGLKSLLSPWFLPEISNGLLKAEGTVTLPRFSFSGDIGVTSFAAALGGKEFLAWDEAAARGFELATGPVRVTAQAMEIEGPELTWLSGKGGTGLTKIFKNPGEPGKLAAIDLPEIKATGGRLRLRAPTAGEPFTVEISDLEGKLTGLKSQAENRTQLELRGLVEPEARLDCGGSAGFFGKRLFADLRYQVSGLEVSRISPYLDEILGYRSKQGKLTAAGTYRLENQELTTNPRFTLSNYQLGPRLEGNTALPLTLALLTDQESRLEITVPVQGSFAEEEFTVTGAITRFVRGLLGKTAVAPFSLLPAPEKGTAQPGPLLFPPGQDKISTDHTATLKALKNILASRPGLQLMINGFADEQKDADALFEIFSQKEAERVRQLEAQLSAQVAAQYGKEEIKPAPGTPKAPPAAAPPPPPVQRKIIEVTPEDLRELAARRRDAVYAFLFSELGPDARRLGKGEIKILPAREAAAAQGKVDFSLGIFKTGP